MSDGSGATSILRGWLQNNNYGRMGSLHNYLALLYPSSDSKVIKHEHGV